MNIEIHPYGGTDWIVNCACIGALCKAVCVSDRNLYKILLMFMVLAMTIAVIIIYMFKCWILIVFIAFLLALKQSISNI